MSNGSLFITCWIVGIVISVVFMATNPARNDLGPKTQRMRTAAIVSGFVPCFLLTTIAQVFYIIAYRASIGVSSAGQAKLNATLSTDFGTPRPTVNPPDSSGTPRPPASDNPFL